MNKLIISIFMLLFAIHAFSQENFVVRGKVINVENGTAVAGATIKLIGSQKKIAYTDKEGDFQVDETDLPFKLEISFIGFRDTIYTFSTAPENSLIIRLQPSNSMLSDVVISTGFQKIPKERVTGSFDYIDNALLNRQAGTDVLSRLDGIASSVLFDNRGLSGNNRAITIRGLSTIFSNKSPLIILNNFPYEGDVNNINPNDIEDITILKDATAASIWGVRAGNGVIVITTKKVKGDKRPRVSFNSNVTVLQKPQIMKLPYMSATDFIEVESMLFEKGFFDNKENSGYQPLSPAVELMYKHKKGLITESVLNERLRAFETQDVRKELNKYIYRQGINQQYSLNVMGQNDNINYYFSGGYDDNVNTTNTGFKRYTLRSDNTIKLSRNLRLDAAIFYTNTQNKQGNPSYSNFSSLYPYTRFADENGDALSVDRYYSSSYIQESNEKGLLNWEYRPLDELNYINNRQKENSLLLNTGLNFDIGKGLNADIKYQFGNMQGIGINIQNIDSYHTRDMINMYTQVNNDNIIDRPVPLGDIMSQTNNSQTSQALRLQLNYTRNWDKHYFTGLVGTEARQANSGSIHSQQFGYNSDILTTSAVNYAVPYPLYSPNGGSAQIPYSFYLSKFNDRFVSLYTNWAYSFDNRYSLSVSARKDGSNLFGVKSNQKMVPLWSIGGSWELSKESFLNIAWLELLKFRTTFGYSGNLNKNVSSLPIMGYNSGGNLINTPYGVLRNPPNENLRWEKNGQFNIGLDFLTKNSRFSGSLEYYYKNNTDLIGYMPIDQTTGAINPATLTFSYLGNSASMVGNGMDIQLHSVNIQKKLQWRTDFLYSFIKTKVTEYLSETNNLTNYITGGQSISPIVGKPIYSIFAYKWSGLDPETGDPMGYLNGEISKDYAAIRNTTTPEELVYYGSAMPTHFGAIRNAFSWKELNLSFNISYKLGFFFRRNSVSYGAIFNGTSTHSDFNLRWQKTGDEIITQVPSMVYPVNANRDGYFYPRAEVLISKGDNLRLQDISLSYHMKTLESKLNLKRFEIFMYATNLGTLWKADNHNVDPEFGYLSPIKTISFGLRTGF